MDIKKTPLAVSVYMVIISVICLLAVMIFPNVSKAIVESWFHGMSLELVWAPANLSFGTIVLGLVSTFVATYIVTWIFVVVYKKIAKI